MKMKYLFTSVAIASALAACGGESSEKSAPIIVPTAAPTAIPTAGPTNEPGDGDIIQTALPVVEDFEGAADVYDLFSEDYKTLATDQSGLATDVNAKAGGINNFYYSIAGLFSDQEVNYNDKVATDTWLTTDTGNQALRLGNSRFTLAQTSSDLASPSSAWFDQRQKSSPGSAESGVSWGELDLTGDYSISFCLIEAGGNDDKKMFVFIDNNQSSKGSSTHGDNSQAYSMPISELKNLVGQRITIEPPVGTANSYIQMRAEGDAWFVIDDLVIEDAAHPAGSVDDCSTKTTVWGDTNPNPPVLEPTTEPTVEPTVTPTQPPVDGSVAWNVYDGSVTPLTADSLTLADAFTTEFSSSNAKPDGTEDFFIANGDGTVGFVTPVDDLSMMAKYDFEDFAPADYPRYFTGLIRAKGVDSFKTVDLDLNLADGTAGTRVKLILRADGSNQGVQVDKGDPAGSKPTAYTAETYSDYRIYQISVELTAAQEGTANVYLAGNDTPIITMIGDTTTPFGASKAGDNFVRFGDGSSSLLDYSSEIDWMIWTDEDAYVPSELMGKLPSDIGDIPGYEVTAPSVAWNVYDGSVIPLAADSLTLADASTATFGSSNAKPDGTEDFFTANGDGTVGFVTPVDDLSMMAKYNFEDFAPADYPRYFTGLIRAKGVDSFKTVDLDLNLADGTAGTRVKLILRADGSNQGVQVDKGDPAGSKPTAYTAEAYSDYRIYQISVELTAAQEGTANVYLAGNDTPIITMIGDTTTPFSASKAGDNFVRFGDGSSSLLDYSSEIDWMIWTDEGAYLPSELTGALPSAIGDTTGY